MNGETRDPEPADDDIPTLTEIVVPGRLRADAQAEVAPAPPEFVFDIDFGTAEERRAESDGDGTQLPTDAPEPAVELRSRPPAGEESDLPLPWSADHPPDLAAIGAAPPTIRPADPEPLIVAVQAKAEAAHAAPATDAQALLRARMDDIADSLEQRLRHELALTEQRLRATLREELDRELRQLLAGDPPTS